MIVTVFGPPGAGKGTQAKFISEKLDIVHLSTGDVLRDQLKNRSKLSLELQEVIDSGQLVSDKILNQIVLKRISQKDCIKGFIFDGYPRTIFQAHFIEEYFFKNNLFFDYFIEIYLENKTIINRITSRFLTESRADDSEKIISTRIDEYNKETRPVLEYYKKQYSSIYHIVNGDQEIDKINSILLRILKK
tara:strand:- start:1035 stop:1604 length:570 start_codon:yes stop_codon:yes gene_type:complete